MPWSNIMKVFRLRQYDGESHQLSRDNYNTETRKIAPWFQNNGHGPKHFAVCPGCDNPIEIVNLFIDTVKVENGEKHPLYARHYRNHVPSIANYVQADYDACPLSNPQSLQGTTATRLPGDKSDEILQIIVKHADFVRYMMDEILGVTMPDAMFEEILASFASQNGHLYRSVSRINIPYAVLYMAKNQRLTGFSQSCNVKIKSPIHALIGKSSYFQLSQFGDIWKKKGMAGQANLNFFFSEHLIPKQNGKLHPTKPQSLKLVVEEVIQGERKILGEVEILMDQLDRFANTITKRERTQRVARTVLSTLLKKV